jgi:hypothetical protein
VTPPWKEGNHDSKADGPRKEVGGYRVLSRDKSTCGHAWPQLRALGISQLEKGNLGKKKPSELNGMGGENLGRRPAFGFRYSVGQEQEQEE